MLSNTYYTRIFHDTDRVFAIIFIFHRWSRKSHKQIPAARALEEDNNVLIIRHANPEDQDVYICTAENSAGAVHTSAQVQVNCKYHDTIKEILMEIEYIAH